VTKKDKKAIAEEQAPEPGIEIATITVDLDGSVNVDFTGMSYWSFRGVVQRVYKILKNEEPHIHISNIDSLELEDE
jgi:hypothetical protein